ncbi:MAG: coproporphyrinogen III oxidase, partial [Geminicoccaceae bacterium]
FDLMYGLPHQTSRSLARTIARAVELGPDRIALFGYAHVPWLAKRQRMLPAEALPGPDERLEQAETAAELLEHHGYQRIGLDHFARPDDAMARAARDGRLARNFQGYTVDRATTLIGLGATAISSLPQGYAQNTAATGAYVRAVSAGQLPVSRGYRLTGEDRVRRAVIERLMCELEVDLAAIATAHGYAPDHFAPELDRCQRFVGEGLLRIEAGKLWIADAGRAALRVVAAQFDQHFASGAGEQPRHAAAV